MSTHNLENSSGDHLAGANVADRAWFDQRVYQNWASYFECDASIIQETGARLFPEKKSPGSKGVHIWHIGNYSFVQLDPAYVAPVRQVLDRLPSGVSLSGDHLQAAWGADNIKERVMGQVYYLYADDLPSFWPVDTFLLRQLSLDDAGHMSELHSANTLEDVEESFVEVDHQIVFGGFAGSQLVAAASGYERAGFMDLGVLTHPAYRGRGLGKAVVGAICKWSIARDMIAQYRSNVENIGSRGVAQSLNFKPYFRQESVWMS